MFYLCTVESSNLLTVFGGPTTPRGDNTPPKYTDLQVVMIGQKPDVSGYLLLADTVVEEFVKQDSVPEGYDFIFRQSWGLTINESIIHRVIETLRAESYPPMADYLDAIVKSDDTQKQKYLDACQAVKVKYPKFSF
jgi:hypothetical protein